MKPRFFATPAECRRWLAANHARAGELWVGFHKKATGKPSITWPESVDEALCYGWIDGIRKSIDAGSYAIRFTPRRAGSIWSAVNVRRVADLTKLKRMRAPGLRAFEKRTPEKTAVYTYEQRHTLELPPAYLQRIKADAAAWKTFNGLAPSYRKLAVFFVLGAKQEETRLKRLDRLIADPTLGRLIKRKA